MANSNLWITYDLGLRGDYEGIYSFLDVHKAVECGDGVAYLNFEFTDDLLGEFTQAIKEAVRFDNRSRVYMIRPKAGGGGYKGRFIVGKRKAPPWVGYGVTEASEDDIGE